MYHLDVRWIACDSWLMDEFVNILFRKCASLGIRIVQTSEFFCTANLHLHPFRAQPYIPLHMPETMHKVNIRRPSSSLSQITATTTATDDDNNVTYPDIVKLAERFYFQANVADWIVDNDQKTDWKALGLESQGRGVKNRQYMHRLYIFYFILFSIWYLFKYTFLLY